MCRERVKPTTCLRGRVHLQRGTYFEPTKVTFGDFMMERLTARHDIGAIRDTTLDGYERHLTNHVLPVLGGCGCRI